MDRVITVLSEELGIDALDQLQFRHRRSAAYCGLIARTRNRGRRVRILRLHAQRLLTGTRLDPSLGSQLEKEIANADRVDILCSFIRWSGLRMIMDELRRLTVRPAVDSPRLRVITTSYMGATDPRVVDALRELPNTEVRVSYDTERTRLHAKAYIIHRDTGFGSAYVGSANLSRACLAEGLEWTTKISQFELRHLWSKVVGTFETYWQDEEFEPFTESSGRDSAKRLVENCRSPAMMERPLSQLTCGHIHFRRKSSTYSPPSVKSKESLAT